MPKTLPIDILSSDQKSYALSILSKYFGEHGSHDLYNELRLILVNKGETLMTQGDMADDMFILLSGSMDALIQVDDEERSVGRIERGESVGEMALLGEGKRSATIRAHRNSLAIQVDKAVFDHAAEHNTTLAATLSKQIIDRLDRSNKKLSRERKKSKFISLIGLNLDVSLNDFVDAIVRYWKEEASVEVVDESIYSSLTDDTFSLKINDLEHHDYVFLLSSEDAEWNHRISQNCDKTVFIGMESDLENIKTFTKEHGVPIDVDELVLVYEQDKPHEVGRWLELFQPNRVFRKRLRHEPDEHRIARIVCEEQICLVFGGGGAHGMANVGVVKSLMEHRIPIDVVGGTSVGAIFSGALAQDWDYHTIYKKVERDISRRNPLNDYTLPMVALLRGNKISRVLRKHFNIQIENSWKNFFCVASNMSTSSEEIIETGPMNRAIEASSAIPGILPPRLYRKSLLIDGGVLNNLPTDVMARKYKGHIITVDVVSNKRREIEAIYKVGNIQFMRNVLTRSRNRYVPNTMNTLMKAVTLASASKTPEKEALSVYFLKPRLRKGFLDWRAMDSFVKEGYDITNSLLRSTDYKRTLRLPRHLF